MWGEMLNKQLHMQCWKCTHFSKKKCKQTSQLNFQIAMTNGFHWHIFSLEPNVFSFLISFTAVHLIRCILPKSRSMISLGDILGKIGLFKPFPWFDKLKNPYIPLTVCVGGGREASIYCSTYLCIHWLFLVCALTGHQTCTAWFLCLKVYIHIIWLHNLSQLLY